MSDYKATCPACAAEAEHYAAASDYNRHVTDEVFNYGRCTDCGLVFIDSVPADIAAFYERGYQQIPASRNELRKLAAKEAYRLKPLLRFKRGGRLLEIGPWIGLFTLNAVEAHFQVDVIEADARAAQFLREQVGVDVAESHVPEKVLESRPETYDAIVLWHSLEHLPNAWRVVQAASAALKPDGVLLIALPNIDSTQSRVTRAHWVHLDAPRHLYFWNAAKLAALCERAGLRTLDITTRDRLSLTLDAIGWYRFVRGKVRLPLLQDVAGVIVGGALTAVSAVLGGKSTGTGITAVFRKEKAPQDH